MIKEYFEEARLNITPLQKSNLYLNSKYQKQLLRNTKMIQIQNMYPSIFVQMFDLGYLPKSEEPYINKIKKWLNRKELGLLESLSNIQLQELRTFKNAYYGNLYRRNQELCKLLVEYVHVFYSKLVDKLSPSDITESTSLIYFDVDVMFLEDNNKLIKLVSEHLDEVDLEYDILDVDYLYIEGLKKYIWTSPSGIEVKGMRSNKRSNQFRRVKDNASLLEEIIKRERRNDRIDELLK